MPLPMPNDGEAESDFISRCMGNPTMREDYPRDDQRAAVCHSQWDKKGATMSDVRTKSLGPLEIKDEATGEVEAIFATLDVVDRDKEVIRPTAIKNGSKVKMSSYGHDTVGFFTAGAMPVGKGAVYVEGDKAVFRGKVFMSTDRGRETLAVLKEMGRDQEWSFGFHVLGSEAPDDEWKKKGAELILTKLHVFEVSPVILGAGIGTQTVTAKEADEEAAAEAARLAAETEARAAAEAETKRLAAAAEADRRALEAAATAEFERFQRNHWRFGTA